MTSLHTRLSVLIGVIALGAVVVLFGLIGREPQPTPAAEVRMMMWRDLLPDEEAEALALLEARVRPRRRTGSCRRRRAR